MSSANNQAIVVPWLSNDRKVVLVQFLIWFVIGMGAVLLGWQSGAEDGFLWVLAATVLLSFSALSAVLGIFISRWTRYLLWCLAAYFGLAVSMALLLGKVSHSAAEELSTFPGMYAAFLMSFFLINAVAGVVRKIAHYTGVE